MLPDFAHCPTKLAYRQKAIVEPWRKLNRGAIPRHRQYVTLCGPLDFNAEGSELVQLSNAGLFEMDQVYGIEKDESVFLENQELASYQLVKPHVVLGEMVDALRHLFDTVPGFSPAIINMDLMVGPTNGLEDLQNVTSMLEYYIPDDPTMLVWNVILQRGGGAKWSKQLKAAHEWVASSDWHNFFGNKAVEYDGTEQTHSLMHTMVLVRGYFAGAVDSSSVGRRRFATS